ncbi:MAG: Dabb family protein [Verrucomicrobiota bacterium]
MIHHVVFYELLPQTEPGEVEEILRTSRTLLLRIPEVLGVKSGRNLDSSSQWEIFVSFEVDSREKLRVISENPFYLKFTEHVVGPRRIAESAMSFEMDPAKDLKYS